MVLLVLCAVGSRVALSEQHLHGPGGLQPLEQLAGGTELICPWSPPWHLLPGEMQREGTTG